MSNDRWVCLTEATFDGGQLVVHYDAQWGEAAEPDTDGSYHLHLYGSDGVDPPADVQGTHADGGHWQVEDAPSPLTYAADHPLVAEIIGDHPMVCARIAGPNDHLVESGPGEYDTGNCATIRRP